VAPETKMREWAPARGLFKTRKEGKERRGLFMPEGGVLGEGGGI